MHFGQIGLWQTKQSSLAKLPGCFRHGLPTGASSPPASTASDVVWVCACTLNFADAGRGGGAVPMAVAATMGASTAGGAGRRSVGASTEALNCWRMISLTAAELSTPQYWQRNWMGLATVWGVTSSAYLTPHWHLILSS